MFELRECPLCKKKFKESEYYIHLLEDIAQSNILVYSAVYELNDKLSAFFEYLQEDDQTLKDLMEPPKTPTTANEAKADPEEKIDCRMENVGQ